VLLLPEDGLLRGDVVELDAELEAELLEVLLRCSVGNDTFG
jgi:hypothetical protein